MSFSYEINCKVSNRKYFLLLFMGQGDTKFRLFIRLKLAACIS